MARAVGEAEVLQQIYDVAERGTRETLDGWQELLGTLAGYLGAEKGHVFLVDPTLHMTEVRFEGDEAAKSRVFVDENALERRAFERTEIFNDFLRRVDISHSMFVNLQFDEGQIAPQGFFRSRGRGAFSREEIQRFERLLPHLARALRIKRLFHAAHQATADLQAVLDAMPAPVALLSRDGKFLARSQSALRLMEALPALLPHHPKLAALRPAPQQQLDVALGHAVTLAEGGAALEGAVPVPVLLPRSGRAPVALLMLPLRSAGDVRARLERQARVLVAFHDPEAAYRIAPERLQALFRFTPTEAGLASALAEGKTVLQFALERGCSEQTARVHLKRVLEKAHVSRQTDLVRVLLGGGALSLGG